MLWILSHCSFLYIVKKQRAYVCPCKLNTRKAERGQSLDFVDPQPSPLMSSRQWETLSRQCLKNGTQGCSLVSTHTGTQVPMYMQRHAHTYKDERGLIQIFGLDVLALRRNVCPKLFIMTFTIMPILLCVHFINFRTLLYSLAHLSIIIFVFKMSIQRGSEQQWFPRSVRMEMVKSEVEVSCQIPG